MDDLAMRLEMFTMQKLSPKREENDCPSVLCRVG